MDFLRVFQFFLGVLEGRSRGTNSWRPHPLRETSERTSLVSAAESALDLRMERAAEALEKTWNNFINLVKRLSAGNALPIQYGEFP